MRKWALIAALLVLAAPQARAAEPVPGSSCAGQNANSFTWSGASQNGGVVNGLFCNGGTNLYTGIINFKSSGNVGIDTTSTNSTLSIGGALPTIGDGTGGSGDGYSFLRFSTGSYNADINVHSRFNTYISTDNIDHPGDGIIFSPNNTEYMRITNTGKVGINQTSPATTLDVNGDITNENVKSCTMVGTDSNGKLICQTPAVVFISTQTASASASLSWTSIGSYNNYQLICSNIIPATNATGFYLQFGEGGGPTWKTANYRYEWVNTLNGVASGGHSTSDSGIDFYGNADNIAPGVSVFAMLVGLSAGHSQVLWENGGLSANGTSYSAAENSGWYTGDTNPITAIKVFMSSGNITSGTCSLYGMN